MNEPVSICIPSYNGEKYLREALRSAVEQTYPHTEILIVDDGSSDGTVAIVEEYAAIYPQIKLVHNTAKAGMVSNWIECIASASHDWIKFLFQDDVLAPDCVGKLLALCFETGIDIAFCARDFIIEEDAPEENVMHFRLSTKPESLFVRGLVSPSSLAKQVVKHGTDNIIGEPVCQLFHKRILTLAGSFDDRFLQLMDYDFALRAALAKGIAFTPEVLVQFRVHGRSQTTNNTSAQEADLLTRKTIRSIYGDQLLLLKTYLSDERFAPVRELWPPKQMVHVMQFLFLKICRRFGEKITRDSLQDVLPQLPEINGMHYNYLRYKLAKYRNKASEKKKSQL
jgi:glycosyltransferase involved in cell wall biosynthesis